MLSHLRLVPRPVQPCARLFRPCAHRDLSLTAIRRTSLAPEPPTDEPESPASSDGLAAAKVEMEGGLGEEVTKPETYNEFLEAIGNGFKKADTPRHWLGGEVPFPMNPSFKPPAPTSDALRRTIYNEFMRDPKANNLRVLSQRYHMSLKRIDAILRLKGMEAAWHKGKKIQTGFLKGMEKLLGVEQDEKIRKDMRIRGEQDWTRYDTHEADTLEEEEQRDASRQRYQRLYWESVPENNREPIIPESLQLAKATAKRIAQAAEAYKSHPKLMPRVRSTETMKRPQDKVQVITKPGRPTIHFVDVGGKFVEVDERLKRIALAERRAKIRGRKAEEKKAAVLSRRS